MNPDEDTQAERKAGEGRMLTTDDLDDLTAPDMGEAGDEAFFADLDRIAEGARAEADRDAEPDAPE